MHGNGIADLGDEEAAGDGGIGRCIEVEVGWQSDAAGGGVVAVAGGVGVKDVEKKVPRLEADHDVVMGFVRRVGTFADFRGFSIHDHEAPSRALSFGDNYAGLTKPHISRSLAMPGKLSSLSRDHLHSIPTPHCFPIFPPTQPLCLPERFSL